MICSLFVQMFDKCSWLMLATAALGASMAVAGDVVYVESNISTGAGNSIIALRRDAEGKLTPLPGSPFSTGGLGISPTYALGPYDSDQNIVVDRRRKLMFAVNGGSDTIAVFRIGHDGGLTPVSGSPFPSGGSNPVSVGLAGDVLCVVNKDQNPDHPGLILPNYTTLHIAASGKLSPIRHGTFTVDAGASPTQALVAPSHGLVFGDDFMGGLIRSFKLGENGRLLERDVQALPPTEFAGSSAPPFP
jgi:hypothetical protein